MNHSAHSKIIITEDAAYIADEVHVYEDDLEAAIYLFNNKLIVTSMIGEAEVGPVTILSADGVYGEEIGAAIRKHLNEYEYASLSDSKVQTVEDTQAFAVSGAASINQFDTESYFARVHTRYGNLDFEAQPLSASFENTGFYVVISMDGAQTDVDVGEAALKAFNAAALLKSQGAYDETLPGND
jgi:hypothetical protein